MKEEKKCKKNHPIISKNEKFSSNYILLCTSGLSFNEKKPFESWQQFADFELRVDREKCRQDNDSTKDCGTQCNTLLGFPLDAFRNLYRIEMEDVHSPKFHVFLTFFEDMEKLKDNQWKTTVVIGEYSIEERDAEVQTGEVELSNEFELVRCLNFRIVYRFLLFIYLVAYLCFCFIFA